MPPRSSSTIPLIKTPPVEVIDADLDANARVSETPDAVFVEYFDAQDAIHYQSNNEDDHNDDPDFATCEKCGLFISFRDEETNRFTLMYWNNHQKKCTSTRTDGLAARGRVPAPSTPAFQAPSSKRTKRTEEERIAYLSCDPYIARFEPYRVLCKSCNRKSCLNKKIRDKLEARNTIFLRDPDIRKFDAERVLCNICNKWFPVNPDNHMQAVQMWGEHRTTCRSQSQATTSVARPSSDPSIPRLTPPKLRPEITASETTHVLQPHPSSNLRSSFCSPHFNSESTSLHGDNLRSWNAEQRAESLMADALIDAVEPHRVLCSLCHKWHRDFFT
ncbi:hypothetical protein H0H92_009306 [Tricholoma furcatifolium]|nr:hypothetical protein H0H92_009306 [Tricholoma furcatifolium]